MSFWIVEQLYERAKRSDLALQQSEYRSTIDQEEALLVPALDREGSVDRRMPSARPGAGARRTGATAP